MSAYRGIAVALLMVGGFAQFGWHHAPENVADDVWNASQALLMLTLLAMVANAYRSAWTWAAASLLGLWQLMTAGCSIAYLIRPWKVEPGGEQCSAALNFPLGAVGGLVLVLAIVGAARKG